MGFVLVHLAVAASGFLDGKAGAWDVDTMYRLWADRVITGTGVPGITEAWVYPAFALVPVLVAWVAGGGDVMIGWPIVVTVLDALAFAMLLGDARSRGRLAGSWFWLAAMLALGPVAMYRLDAITVPLAVAGSLWLVGRPWVASVLLACATWIKVWPAALLAAAFVAVRRRGAVLWSAVAVSALIAVLVISAGGAGYLFGFIGDQTERGLQIEAPVSTVFVWMAAAGAPGSGLYFNQDLLTFEVTGPGANAVIAVMTPVLAVAVLGVMMLGAVQAMRGVRFVRLFPALSLAFVLAFIALNKVGSPQYMVWLVPPLVIGLVIDRARWWIPATVTVGVLAVTQLIFPWLYDLLLFTDPFGIALLTVRNLALLVLFVWSVIVIARARVHVPGARTVLPDLKQ